MLANGVNAMVNGGNVNVLWIWPVGIFVWIFLVK